MKKSFDYSGLLIPFVFAVLVAYQLLMAQPATTSISYSDFHRLVDARLVDDLDIGPSSISGVLRMPQAGANLPASDAAAVKRRGRRGASRPTGSLTIVSSPNSRPPASAIAARRIRAGSKRLPDGCCR